MKLGNKTEGPLCLSLGNVSIVPSVFVERNRIVSDELKRQQCIVMKESGRFSMMHFANMITSYMIRNFDVTSATLCCALLDAKGNERNYHESSN